MNTPGENRQLYVRARAGLLDAADALGVHLDAVVLVGAQAVYTHTSETEFVVDEYTTDADFANRLSDKDALDVLRLLQSVSTDDLCARLVGDLLDELAARPHQGASN